MHHRIVLSLVFCLATFSTAFPLTISGTQLLRDSQLQDNTMQEGPTGVAGLVSYAFLTQVGGVNFELYATFDNFESGSIKSLEYVANASDGSRAILTTTEGDFTIPLSDWILLPTTAYANSSYTAVVSLFGPETTAERYHIRYHPALEDTLLGLRMLQADMLPLLPPGELPDEDGQIVLGEGEQIPEPVNGLSAYFEINTAMAASVPPPDSWVLTDVGSEGIGVQLLGGEVIPVSPIYYSFWACPDPQVCAATDEVDRLEPLISKVRRLPVRQLNPTVWNAAEALAGYAAFFRTLKRDRPDIWQAFYASVLAVDKPYFDTPNVIPRS